MTVIPSVSADELVVPLEEIAGGLWRRRDLLVDFLGKSLTGRPLF